MSAAEPVGPALAASLLLHAAVAALALAVGARHAPTTVRIEAGASWAGDTFDVDELIHGAGEEETEPSETAPAADPAQDEGAPLPKAKPKPRVRHEPPPGSTESPAPAGAPGGSGETGGQRGAESNAPANLAKAFTKAVTAATNRDPLWDDLPLGEVGVVEVVITIDTEGHISASTLKDAKKVPDPLERLVERTLLLLRAGRFAFSTTDTSAGTETLRIAVRLSAGEAAEDFDDPRHTVSLGFDPPGKDKPGRAYFTHASGRRFEARVSLVE